MKTFLANLRNVAVAGFFFLFPLYILFIIATKAWTSLSSLGTGIAGIFGMKSILGVGGSTVISGLLLVAIWILCGLVARFSFASTLKNTVERTLANYIPGYDTYKAMAEEKLNRKAKVLPYTSALVRWQDYWQPAFIVEQDGAGNYVVFLPDSPETHKGHVLLAKGDQIRTLSLIPANQFDATLKKMGKGLLSEYSKGLLDKG
jgi:uncharacterized membrane protein